MPKNHPENFSHCSRWMKKLLFTAALIFSAATVSQSVKAAGSAAPAEKEWTLLLFLNGHNNLDSYGAYNLNQMEQVGSNENLNMVVQWASEANGKTRRLLVKKDNDTPKVTSPAVETMNAVDMGDYHNLVEFVRWGVKNYPAKHYMIAVWNHGNGWHLMNNGFHTNDISYDDNSGNHITTEQLALAMDESAKIIGHKVDIYGSDACLMAMVEIAAQMKNSVQYFVGSEETEPGYGWPYNTWMARWAANPKATGAEVATYLTEEYIKAYDGGIYGTQDVTYSAYDLSRIDGLLNSIKALNVSLSNLSPTDFSAAKTAANGTMSFALDDYKDLENFTSKLSSSKVSVNSTVLNSVKDSIADFVIAHGATGVYEGATGVAIWLPTSSYELSPYADRYSKLEFNKATGWLSFLQKVAK
jgi:hypothetical protein